MKTTIVKMLIGTILLILMIPPVFCQLPKKVVSYTTLQQQHFSIPSTIEIAQVNSLDFNKMISHDKKVSTEISFDRRNNPTITTIYHVQPRYFNDYENQITKSVTGNGQTILYDYHNNEVKRTRHHPEENMEIILRNEDVNKYGVFNDMFRNNPQIMHNNLYQMGFDVRYLSSSNTLLAISEEVEILIDFRNFIYEMRYFEEREFLQSVTNYYQDFNGVLIPLSSVTCATSSLEGGIRLLTTTVVTYLEYRVVNELGKDVVHFISTEEIDPKRNMQISSFEEVLKRDLQLKVYPNPTSDQVTVMIPFFMENGSTIEIVNTAGVTIYKNDQIKGSSYQLDVSSFINGIYLVRCIGNGEQVTAKLVKQ
jgi:hypothetical protein